MATLLKQFVALAACFMVTGSYAQVTMPEFGKVDTADLLMKECPFDKGAAAMNLLCYQNASFESNLSGDFVDIQHWVRIKIFNQQGFEHATVVIPYVSANRESRITNINAKTYNINDRGVIETVTITKQEIFKEKTDRDESAVRFTFPGVKPGSVIELTYTEKKEYTVYLEPWLLQHLIPTRLSVCKLTYPTALDVVTRITGSLPLINTTDTSWKQIISNSFTASNIKAFTPEPMMTSLNDNLQKIEFAITPYNHYWMIRDSFTLQDKWGYLIYSLLRSPLFGTQIQANVPGTGDDISRIKNLPSTADKVKAVYDLVTHNIRWNKSDYFSNTDLAGTWQSKSGSKTEINLLLLNLLQKTGVHAYPLLVSTRENGKTNIDFPDFGQFSGTDVLVEDGDTHFVLDGTLSHQSYKLPPYNILNRYALIIDKKQCKWIYVNDKRPLLKNFVSVKAELDSTGILKGEVRINYHDYAKADVLTRKSDEESTSKDLLQSDINDIKIDSVKQMNIDDPELPLIKAFAFTLSMNQTGKFYFLDPFFLSPFKKNPFTSNVRKTEVDFGCNQYYSVNMYITLPPNITVSDLPTNKEIILADSSFSFARFTAAQNNAIIIRSHFEISSPVFSTGEYPSLKQAFEKMYALLNERIVLKKED